MWVMGNRTSLTQSLNGERLGVWLAAVNSLANSVLSGEVSAIAAIEEELKKEQRKCTRVRITKAFRSVLIQEAAETLKDVTWLAQPSPVAGWDVLDESLTEHGALEAVLREGFAEETCRCVGGRSRGMP